MSVMHITKENFQEEVICSDKPVLLDFWAAWCNPCRRLAPIIEQIAIEHPEIKVCKVDVSEEPELAARFQVVNIPTLIVMKDGKTVNQSIGAIPKAQILAML